MDKNEAYILQDKLTGKYVYFEEGDDADVGLTEILTFASLLFKEMAKTIMDEHPNDFNMLRVALVIS